MARIKFGMMMTDARGKLGGQVFTKTRSGAAVRTKVTPSNPQTASQGSVRSAFGIFSQGWNGLTEAQRQSWNSAVDEYKRTNVFGDQYKLSGKNLYMSINQNLSTIGVAAVDNVPEIKTTAGITLDSASMNLADDELDISSVVVGSYSTGSKIVYEATAALSPGKYNFSGAYRIFNVSALGGDPLSPAVMYNYYVFKFGTPPPDKKISIRAYIIDSVAGISSPKSTIELIVAAS